MIEITQDEAIMLRENNRGKDVHMTSRNHRSKAKKYYATTSEKSMKLLDSYRNRCGFVTE